MALLLADEATPLPKIYEGGKLATDSEAVIHRDLKKQFRGDLYQMAEELRWLWQERLPGEVTQRWAPSIEDVLELLSKHPAQVILEGMKEWGRRYLRQTKRGSRYLGIDDEYQEFCHTVREIPEQDEQRGGRNGR